MRVRMPAIVNPSVTNIVAHETDLLKEFCRTFANEETQLTRFLTTIFESLLDPNNLEKYKQAVAALRQTSIIGWEALRSIRETLPEDEEKLPAYHKGICTLREYYKDVEQYSNDIRELDRIVHRDSTKVKNHSSKLFMWARNGCDPSVERLLDGEILSEIKQWCMHACVKNAKSRKTSSASATGAMAWIATTNCVTSCSK